MVRAAARMLCIALLLSLPAVAAPAYRVTVMCGRAACAVPVEVATQRYARLMTSVTTLRLAISPAPERMPSVTWRSNDPSRARITATSPYGRLLVIPGDTAATPAPDPLQAVVVPGSAPGATTIVADVGAPVYRRLSIPVYAYRSAEVGCYFVSLRGVRETRDGVLVAAANAKESDLYVTGPADRPPFFGCGTSWSDGTANYTIHAPFGATIASTGFFDVSPGEWRDAFHTRTLPLGGGTFLFKTRNGDIVKLAVSDEDGSIQGPYLAARAGQRFADRSAGTRIAEVSLPRRGALRAPLSAYIDYNDPLSATYGIPDRILTSVPWTERTSFFQGFGSVRVVVTPQPYAAPSVRWSVDGNTATVDARGVLRGRKPGESVLVAAVGAPVNRTLRIPIVSYATLDIWCGVGVRIEPNGALTRTASVAQSDIYLSSDPATFECNGQPRLFFPGGGTMLVNGGSGSQFPDIGATRWRNAMISLDIQGYRRFVDPCMVPAGMPGAVRADPRCTARQAHILLFRTRSGRFVKWLIEVGNGLNQLAGPYQAL